MTTEKNEEKLSARERVQEMLRKLQESDDEDRRARDERDAEAYTSVIAGLKTAPVIVEFATAPSSVVGTVILRPPTDLEIKVLNSHVNGKGSTTDKEEHAFKFVASCLLWPSKEELRALYKAVPLADGQVMSRLLDAAKGTDKGKG